MPGQRDGRVCGAKGWESVCGSGGERERGTAAPGENRGAEAATGRASGTETENGGRVNVGIEKKRGAVHGSQSCVGTTLLNEHNSKLNTSVCFVCLLCFFLMGESGCVWLLLGDGGGGFRAALNMQAGRQQSGPAPRSAAAAAAAAVAVHAVQARLHQPQHPLHVLYPEWLADEFADAGLTALLVQFLEGVG